MFWRNVVKCYYNVAVTFFENVLKCFGAFSASLHLTLCIYCLYLRRSQKCLNHSAIHLTCLYIYLHPVLYIVYVYVICCQLVCLLIMYVYCMYLSWRHGRTAPWPSCLSRLKNLIQKKPKKTLITTFYKT